MNAVIHQLSFIKIIYEKKTRTKTYHTERRTYDCFQHSYFIAFQQGQGSFGLPYDPDLPVRGLDDFHCDFFCNCKKVR